MEIWAAAKTKVTSTVTDCRANSRLLAAADILAQWFLNMFDLKYKDYSWYKEMHGHTISDVWTSVNELNTTCRYYDYSIRDKAVIIGQDRIGGRLWLTSIVFISNADKGKTSDWKNELLKKNRKWSIKLELKMNIFFRFSFRSRK